jgi:hypothetical protein
MMPDPLQDPEEPAEELPPEEISEPDDGPKERVREFLEERFTPIRQKGEPEPGGMESLEDTADAAEERREALEEFRRRRQQRQIESLPIPPQEEELESGPPPEPPSPPPANNWIPIGPSVLRQGQGGVNPATSGRCPAIAVAPGGLRLYVGAANGGVWRSDDAGITWHSLMEAFDLNPTTPASNSLAVGAIAIDPANTDRVYVGSGEGSGAAYFGVGPIVTNNGTAAAPAWITESVAPGSDPLAGSAFYALAVDPTDADRVVAATRRGAYRREPNGVGGFHWAQKSVGGVTNQRVTSVVAAVSGGMTTFYAARQNGPVYSSADGHTWTQVGAGFPAGVMRVSLAVRADNPNVVYALAQNGSVYRLDVADGTWHNVTGVPAGLTGSQGWYDLAIAVAPDNVNRIYLGGSTVCADSNGNLVAGPCFVGVGDWSGALYRCDINVTTSGGSITGANATNTYIGGSVHADIHTIVFPPGDATNMWVGCDGGVFHSSNPTGSGNIFISRNLGLQTLTMEYLGQHPTEDAVLFSGTQDNGGVRFTGEETWLYSSGGDGGYAIVNWNDPYRILSSYVFGCIRRSTNGGQRYSYTSVNVPMVDAQCNPSENCLFYAPIAGTPPNPGSSTAAADADLVAFGSIRPWISTTFGGGWQSIPNNTLAGDSLNGAIKSLTFASPNRLYAGTMNGGVYRFDRAGGAWTRTQIDTLGGANQLQLAAPITDIAVDPANSTRVYVTLGGTGDYRHVWFFDGAQWAQRSGPAVGSSDSLLDVYAGAIVVDPANTAHLYMGTDIGVWRSTNSGVGWAPYSEGLPDAAVMDLVLHNPRRLLRAATHGRGVWERTLPDSPKQGVELYVRDTQLDQGRFTTLNGLADPTAPGQTVRHWAGPDIKLDTPDAMGQYQFPLSGTIDFHQFVDTLSDDFQNVATHASATITTRVYVQVHNRGVIPANNVRVMLLLANASAGLPALPAGYWVNVQNGMPITTTNWRTLGFTSLNDVRVGMPKIAAFDLPSTLLPPPASLAGNQHHCVLALIHHADDPYTSTDTNTDNNSRAERKAAHKNLHVVQFTGTLPAPPPLIIPFRIHNSELEREIRTNLILQLNGYPGRGGLYVPPLRTDRPLEESISGLEWGQEFESFDRWARDQEAMIHQNLESEHPYDKEWSVQRLEDMRQAQDTRTMFHVSPRTKEAHLLGIHMAPDSYHTFFLALERPEGGEIGDTHMIDILQTGRREATGGGLTVRVELVEEPDLGVYRLKLWRQKWLFGYQVIRATLFDTDEKSVGPAEGAMVQLAILEGDRRADVTMMWHASWYSFYYYIRSERISRVSASGYVQGRKVAESHME